jgi:hypothetical protein
MEITEQAIHLLAKVATEVQARFTGFSDLATVGSMSTGSIISPYTWRSRNTPMA